MKLILFKNIFILSTLLVLLLLVNSSFNYKDDLTTKLHKDSGLDIYGNHESLNKMRSNAEIIDIKIDELIKYLRNPKKSSKKIVCESDCKTSILKKFNCGKSIHENFKNYVNPFFNDLLLRDKKYKNFDKLLKEDNSENINIIDPKLEENRNYLTNISKYNPEYEILRNFIVFGTKNFKSLLTKKINGCPTKIGHADNFVKIVSYIYKKITEYFKNMSISLKNTNKVHKNKIYYAKISNNTKFLTFENKTTKYLVSMTPFDMDFSNHLLEFQKSLNNKEESNSLYLEIDNSNKQCLFKYDDQPFFISRPNTVFKLNNDDANKDNNKITNKIKLKCIDKSDLNIFTDTNIFNTIKETVQYQSIGVRHNANTVNDTNISGRDKNIKKKPNNKLSQTSKNASIKKNKVNYNNTIK